MRLPVLAPLLVLALISGCGSSSDPSLDAGPLPPEPDAGVPDAGPPDAGGTTPDAGPVDAGFGPFAAEQWCEMSALATCEQAQRCLRLDAEKVEVCRQRALLNCKQEEFSAGVAGNRLRFLDQKAAECINGYAQASCGTAPDACGQVFEGLSAPASACLILEECQGGSYCYAGGNACPAVCQAYQPIGGPCNYGDRQCDPGQAQCRTVGSANTCVSLASEGGACTYWSDCKAGLGCVGSVCTKVEAKFGESCGQNQGYPLCQDEDFCRLPLGATSGTGVCARKAGLDGVCSGYGSCLPGLRCSSNYSTGTCVKLGSEDDVCWNYNDCRNEMYCDVATSRCKTYPADGGDCSSEGSSYSCAPGYYCDYDVYFCRPLKGEGEACNYSTACQSGECLYGGLGDGGTGYRCDQPCVERLDGGTGSP